MCVCVCVCARVRVCVCVCWLTVFVGNPKVPFSTTTTPRRSGGRHSSPLIALLPLDPYFIMHGGIKNDFWDIQLASTLLQQR